MSRSPNVDGCKRRSMCLPRFTDMEYSRQQWNLPTSSIMSHILLG
jgi:hypothetical protein